MLCNPSFPERRVYLPRSPPSIRGIVYQVANGDLRPENPFNGSDAILGGFICDARFSGFASPHCLRR
jgi:hypothetical protein